MLSLPLLIATPDIHDPACPGIQSNAVPLAVLAGPVVIIPWRTIGGANRIVSAMIYDPSAMRAAQVISIGISIVARPVPVWETWHTQPEIQDTHVSWLLPWKFPWREIPPIRLQALFGKSLLEHDNLSLSLSY